MRDYLAERIRLGDEQAFELVFHKYFARLCGFANKFLNDQEAAKEIVQDVFVRIWSERKNIDPDHSLKSYIFKITQNMSLNRLRRKDIESKYNEVYKLVYIENHDISAHESLLAKELEKNITSAIDRLPPECRKIFNLSRIDGLKYSEIALRLNISVKTVEAQMSKALKVLRKELNEYLLLLVLVMISRL